MTKSSNTRDEKTFIGSYSGVSHVKSVAQASDIVTKAKELGFEKIELHAHSVELEQLKAERDCYRVAFQDFYYEVKSWSDTYMEVNSTCTQTSLTIALPKAQEALAKYTRKEGEG